jgi:hypothetical protein
VLRQCAGEVVMQAHDHSSIMTGVKLMCEVSSTRYTSCITCYNHLYMW